MYLIDILSLTEYLVARFRPFLGAYGVRAGGLFIVPHLPGQWASVFEVPFTGPST